MAPDPHVLWTDDRDAQLCALHADGDTAATIAATMGIGRGAVTGRITRLRAAGDPRLSPAGPGPIRIAVDTATLAPIDALAEHMATGCASIEVAARRMRLSVVQARGLWSRIRRGLGAQAA